jgi:Predicted ATPase
VRLEHLTINGYRSIRRIRLPVETLSVLVGANGVGKTNLYKGLALARSAATGTLAEDIAREGGLDAVLWGGPRKEDDKAMRLAVDLRDGDGTGYSYEVRVTLPDSRYEAAFSHEARIREERLYVRAGSGKALMMERDGPSAWGRDGGGRKVLALEGLMASETALSRMGPQFPEVHIVRSTLADWRFYHGFRTDAGSPLRRPALAVATPMLSPSGDNLAAVFATLAHVVEDDTDLHEAFRDAFPEAALHVGVPEAEARFHVSYRDIPGRVFGAAELSDGTMQYLALMGALLSTRLPPFVALNEPETSLHPDLMPALAKLVARAARKTQVWVVTHSEALASALAEETGILPRTVIRRDGATWIEGLTGVGGFEDDR